MNNNFAIAVHGGAGTILRSLMTPEKEALYIKGLQEAIDAGHKILKEGDGAAVTVNDTLVINYKGQLLNGFVFDQTKDKPATFPLKRLIKGWQIGLPFCKQGGKIRIIIPSALGYSIRNLAVIPPNNVLIFDIEVLAIKPGK